MSNLPLFVDRQVTQGEEDLYNFTDLGNGKARINFAGTIETPGTRINAATLNPIVNHVNDDSIHITRAEFNAAISSLNNRVQLIESTFPDSFNHNLFTEDLVTLDAVKLTRGYYNEAQSRLEV